MKTAESEVSEARSLALPVTVVVSTKNEERAIATCLESLGDFAQIIVVDSGSEDRTAQIVQSMGIELVDFRWNGRYPKKKQWSLDNLNIKFDWVLFIDADERPSEAFIEELKSILESPTRVAAYDVPLEYVFAGRVLRHGHTVVKRALIRPQFVRFPELDDLGAPGMGELEGHYQPLATGRVERMSARLIHDDPDPIASWIDRHNHYSDWEAYLRTHPTTASEIRRLRSRQGRLFDAIPGKPLLFFIYSVLIKRGFLDGRAGLSYAAGLSFYYFLIDLKVRERLRNAAGSETEQSDLAASD